MKGLGKYLLGLVYPDLCEVCGRSLVSGEEVLCLHCLDSLPRTGAHGHEFNLLHKRLASTTPVEKAAGYFHYYRESPYVDIIHRAKYGGRPELIEKMARRYARELADAGFFDGIDAIAPVPLHRLKQWRRGYNQSRYIAAGICSIVPLPVVDNLVASRGHASQTSSGVFARWLNAGNVYDVRRPRELDGLHLLVVDDVITTGATLLACCNAIKSAAPSCRVSVLTLAVAHMS